MGRNQIIEEKNEIKKTVKIPSSMLKISFCDFLRKYNFAKEIEIEKSTFKGYKNILENHIFPYFGKNKILFVNISSEEINKYLNFKIEKGFSSSTVKKHREVIGQALRTAYGKGWISTDMCIKA